MRSTPTSRITEVEAWSAAGGGGLAADDDDADERAGSPAAVGTTVYLHRDGDGHQSDRQRQLYRGWHLARLLTRR